MGARHHTRTWPVVNKMLKLFALVIPVICSADDIGKGHETPESKFYRVSMVSSPEDPAKPALFSHAESPVWDAESNSLYFVNVHKQDVHRLDYDSGYIYTQHIEYGQVNVVSLVSDSRRLLVAVRSSLFLMEWGVTGDQCLRLLTTVDIGQPDNVINEGKPDANGRFWAGTKGPQKGDVVTADRGQFFSIEQDCLSPKLAVKPVTVSNGLVWSLNNSVLYYIDSPTQKVDAFDYDLRRGILNIGARRTIVDITHFGYEDAIPDGLTIDNEGHLWIALMFGGAVLHVNPDTRTVVFGYKLPVSRITSLTWGGPNYDELFVTTSRDPSEVLKEPYGGAIFTLRNTGSVGVAPNSFKYDCADGY